MDAANEKHPEYYKARPIRFYARIDNARQVLRNAVATERVHAGTPPTEEAVSRAYDEIPEESLCTLLAKLA